MEVSPLVKYCEFSFSVSWAIAEFTAQGSAQFSFPTGRQVRILSIYTTAISFDQAQIVSGRIRLTPLDISVMGRTIVPGVGAPFQQNLNIPCDSRSSLEYLGTVIFNGRVLINVQGDYFSNQANVTGAGIEQTLFIAYEEIGTSF